MMKYNILGMTLSVALIITACGRSSQSVKKYPYSIIAEGDAPASFSIIKNSDTSIGIDGNLWIQFSIATQDIAKVIESGKYTSTASPTSFSGMYPPEWWNEEEWRTHMSYFERKRYHEKHKDILKEQKVLWIDRKTGEAFFAYASF